MNLITSRTIAASLRVGVVFLVALAFCCISGAQSLKEASYGAPPVLKPRKTGKDLLEYKDENGKVITIGKDEVPPVPVVVRKLGAKEAKRIMDQAGGSIMKVPVADDALSSDPPMIPKDMIKPGEIVFVLCLLEVNPDGNVGRVFSVGDCPDPVFRVCYRAFRNWKFPGREKVEYRHVGFGVMPQQPKKEP